jgi:hypothetical protein
MPKCGAKPAYLEQSAGLQEVGFARKKPPAIALVVPASNQRRLNRHTTSVSSYSSACRLFRFERCSLQAHSFACEYSELAKSRRERRRGPDRPKHLLSCALRH